MERGFNLGSPEFLLGDISFAGAWNGILVPQYFIG
jgi:hypothetical protein